MSNAAKRVTIDNETHKIVKSLGVVDGKNRKIYKSYAVVDGKTRLCYMSELLAFTGAISAPMTVDIDGVPYAVYTLTTDGVVSVYADEALFWMCGGGAGGETPHNGLLAGGGGGGAYCVSGKLTGGKYPVVIGQGGAASEDCQPTTLGVHTAEGGKTGVDGFGGNGGSGGGGTVKNEGNYVSIRDGGKGDGVAKYPFGVISLQAHCAGGGGGRLYHSTQHSSEEGGDGGSNGSDGKGGQDSESEYYYSYGGEKGGGNGGSYGKDGSDATFYGSGGGGGGTNSAGFPDVFGIGGKGYQGVVYIAIRIA